MMNDKWSLSLRFFPMSDSKFRSVNSVSKVFAFLYYAWFSFSSRVNANINSKKEKKTYWSVMQCYCSVVNIWLAKVWINSWCQLARAWNLKKLKLYHFRIEWKFLTLQSELRRRFDVQIDRLTLVQGRKTNRTI